MSLSPSLHHRITIASGLKLGAAIGLSGVDGKTVGQTVASQIKTQEQLDTFLQQMKEHGDRIPTFFRHAIKEVGRSLPRRGGPGRHYKLDLKEATQMCDEIASILRQKKVTQKQALRIASERSPKILGGKKVGARTLWEVWNNRDKLDSVYGP